MLIRRQLEIKDILYALGRASGQEIQERLADRPGYSGVRTILRVLERKGHIRHVEEGLRYVYEPMVEREKARQSAIERLVRTFFDGSVKAAAAAFLDPAFRPSFLKKDLDELEELIRRARKDEKIREVSIYTVAVLLVKSTVFFAAGLFALRLAARSSAALRWHDLPVLSVTAVTPSCRAAWCPRAVRCSTFRPRQQAR